MPIVEVKMLSGRTEQQKKEIAEAMTQVMVEKAGAKKEAVIVVINDVEPDSYAVGGEMMSEKLKK